MHANRDCTFPGAFFKSDFFCGCVGVLIPVVSGVNFDNSGAFTSNALQECLNIIHISVVLQ